MGNHAATVEHLKDLYLQHTATIERLQAVNNDLFYGQSLPEERRDELKGQLAELDEKAADLDRQITEATPAAEAAADALWAAGEYERFFLATNPTENEVATETDERVGEVARDAAVQDADVETVAEVAPVAESVSVAAEKTAPVVEPAVKVEPVASTGGYSTPGYSTSGYSTPGYSTPGYSAAAYDEDEDEDVFVDDDEDVDDRRDSLCL